MCGLTSLIVKWTWLTERTLVQCGKGEFTSPKGFYIEVILIAET